MFDLLISTPVLNGLLLPVVLVAILRLVNDPRIMGRRTNGRLYNLLAWLTVAFVVALSSACLLITTLGMLGFAVG